MNRNVASWDRVIRVVLADKALWQQFKAQKGQDELAAEIAKMNP